MKWRAVLALLVLVMLAGCALGSASWSRTGRSNCMGQASRTESGESGLVFFCAESP